MGNSLVVIVGFFGLIVGLAMVAVLVSQKAQTTSIISALASGGSQLIGAAVAPVSQTGNTGL